MFLENETSQGFLSLLEDFIPAYSSGETPGQALDKVEPNGTGIESRHRVCAF